MAEAPGGEVGGPRTSSSPPQALLELAVEACRTAGRGTLAFAERGGWRVAGKSGADDLVTDADRAS
ncbi:MAG: hypothetical protein H0W27_05050 [Actinobacteria bacterium]|nr:hypothetical protein [Actinomycetota bacterium]